jgi:Holliday junction resolvase
MAFLQRIVTPPLSPPHAGEKGGTVQREFAIGSGRVDVTVRWGEQVFVIELKIRRGEGTEAEGVEQLAEYLERLGLKEGYLVLFDRRKKVGWSRKLFERTAEQAGRRIHVFGV